MLFFQRRLLIQCGMAGLEGHTQVQFTNLGVGRRGIVCTFPADLCDTEQGLAVALTRNHLMRGGVFSWPATGLSFSVYFYFWGFIHTELFNCQLDKAFCFSFLELPGLAYRMDLTYHCEFINIPCRMRARLGNSGA
jgi:hypothetical protein